ncbi:SusC/RagA family TonB-linked outer membrane protein [Wenyingzhuangia sp. IMCC45533]
MQGKLHLLILILLINTLSFSQETLNIRGEVKNNEGEILPYTTILNEKSSQKTVTNDKGKFRLTAEKGSVLSFRFLGYKTKELEVRDSNYLTIVLEKEVSTLEEVVVIGFGIKREKKSLGTSTFTINSENLNHPAASNLSNSLKGKVPGANITSASSSPGSSSGILLRGINSLSSSNQPLIVVDGVPLNNYSVFSGDFTDSFNFGRGIDGINVEDIETLTVVKGASETAVYGSRAANGLINITTKKGEKNKLSVDVSSTVSFSNILKAPKYQNTFGQGFFGQPSLSENVSWGESLNNQDLKWGNTVDGVQQSKRFSAQKNQIKEFYETGIDVAQSISLYGGNDTSYGKLSFSNVNSDGINPGNYDTHDRNTISGAFSTQVGKINFGGNINYVKIDGKSVPGGERFSVINSVIQIPVDIDVNSLSDLDNPYNTVSNYFTPFAINPYFALKYRGATLKENRFYGALFLDYKLNDLITFKYHFGLDHNSQNVTSFSARVKPTEGSPNFSRVNDDGFYAEANIMVRQNNHDFTINLEKNHTKKISTTTTIGLNVNEVKNDVSSASVTTQDIFGYYSLNNSVNTPEIGRNSILGRSLAANNDLRDGLSERLLYGLFASTTISYNNRLFITANLRNDWNSTLPKKNRSVLYGGINSSWIFTETFKNTQNILNYGKLRIGYGETGLSTNPYNVFSEFLPTSVDNQGFRRLNFPLNGISSYELSDRAENLNLKAERRQELELGTELWFLNNRLGLDFTYYYALTKDQILPLPLAPTTGFSHQIANVGTISNEGLEVSLNVNWLRNYHGFSWSTAANYTVSNSVLEELDGRLDKVILTGTGTTNLIIKEGEKIGLIEGNVPKRSPDGAIIVDRFGIPKVAAEKEVFGNTQYDYTMGLTNTFAYKNLSFSFTLDTKQGGLMYTRTAHITRFTGNSIVTTEDNREPFLVPNSVQEVIGADGNITYTDNNTSVSSGNLFFLYDSDSQNRNEVIDKSFVKLREVVLKYKLKDILISKAIKIKELTMSIIGRNLKLWTPSENKFIDPESSSFGTDLRGQFGEFSLTPNTKSISFSLKASL